jgi:hypothetical protein
VIQVGPDDPFFDFNSRGWERIQPFVTLRAGTSIENYARKLFKDSF